MSCFIRLLVVSGQNDLHILQIFEVFGIITCELFLNWPMTELLHSYFLLTVYANENKYVLAYHFMPCHKPYLTLAALPSILARTFNLSIYSIILKLWCWYCVGDNKTTHNNVDSDILFVEKFVSLSVSLKYLFFRMRAFNITPINKSLLCHSFRKIPWMEMKWND